MKSLFFLPVLFLMFSCSSDDATEKESEASVLGRWYLETTTVNGTMLLDDDEFECEVEKDFYIEFKANLSFTVFDFYECQDDLRNGSYETYNNNIEVILDGDTFIYEIVILTKDRLALKFLEDDNDDDIPEIVVLTFKK